ncbi:MAG: zinc-dependent peptidase [Chitinophagaceae bacterium]|nr:zinc-dependent peptidase [Chitinophagaceae bacterium]
MPQHSTITFYDSAGNVIPFDSMPDAVKYSYDSMLHEREVYGIDKDGKNNGKDDTYMPFLFILIFIIIIIKTARNAASKQDDEDTRSDNVPENYSPGFLTYRGDELNFSDDELVKVLNKHFVYYTRLAFDAKLKFFQRLKTFMKEKVFVIHDESGFKEMPILISASAVQISFGLEKYLLPNFSHIHIFPEAFIGVYPTLRLLEGNVSGHTVNLSWKHFMDGYKYPLNGQNVGLHEFAHAYYYQYFETGENVERDFVATFPKFDECGNRAFQQEKLPGNDLYSDYALTNFQEFWAESVEIFFERPADMKRAYEDLYNAICQLLNQEPVNNTSYFS